MECFFSGSSWRKIATISPDQATNGEPRLYKGHEPATFLQKSILAVGSAVMGLVEPTRSGGPLS